MFADLTELVSATYHFHGGPSDRVDLIGCHRTAGLVLRGDSPKWYPLLVVLFQKLDEVVCPGLIHILAYVSTDVLPVGRDPLGNGPSRAEESQSTFT
jgi:hypothetical protein